MGSFTIPKEHNKLYIYLNTWENNIVANFYFNYSDNTSSSQTLKYNITAREINRSFTEGSITSISISGTGGARNGNGILIRSYHQ